MDGMPLRILLRSLFCAGILGIVACGQVSSTKADVAGPNPIDTGGASTPPPPSGGGGGTVVNSAGFFLAITGGTNADMAQYLHQADAAYGSDIGTTNFSTECKIAHGSADGGDLLCVAEIEELDTYFNDLRIQFHVPSDMCTYLRVRPYWFYAYEPGTGPSIVSHEILFNGTINDVLNTTNGKASCAYDYTSTEGPNCCLGTYNHRIVAYASDGTVASDTTTKNNWGGKPGNCAAGAATSLAGFGRLAGLELPLARISYVAGIGLNDLLDVTAPISAAFSGRSPLLSNLWSVNFYTPSLFTGGKPDPLEIPAAVSGANSLYLPADTYDFQCLDAAQDIRQRIRLLVREWNTHAITEGGNPDVTGAEPGYPGFPLNDRADWDDFGDIYPASTL